MPHHRREFADGQNGGPDPTFLSNDAGRYVMNTSPYLSLGKEDAQVRLSALKTAPTYKAVRAKVRGYRSEHHARSPPLDLRHASSFGSRTYVVAKTKVRAGSTVLSMHVPLWCSGVRRCVQRSAKEKLCVGRPR